MDMPATPAAITLTDAERQAQQVLPMEAAS